MIPEWMTDRRHQILQGVVAGWMNKEIGDYLGISKITVAHHLTTVKEHAQMQDATRTKLAVHAALEWGIRPFSEPRKNLLDNGHSEQL